MSQHPDPQPTPPRSATPMTSPPSSMEWRPTNPPAPQPPQRQKSWFARHKVLTTVLVLVALFILAGAFSNADDATTASSVSPTQAAADTDQPQESADPVEQPEEPAQEPAPEPAAAGIGDAVRDGKFEFVVTSVEDGGTEIGDDFLSETAQGRFHFVHVTVTNIGDQAQMMFDSAQKVRDEQGRTFESNSTAGIYLADSDLWLTEINPGNSVSGTLVFDMPEGSSPVEIELHDSVFSGGVVVSLT